MRKKSKLFFSLAGTVTAAMILLSGCGKQKKEATTTSASTSEKTVAETSAKPIKFNLQRIPQTIDPALRSDVSASRALGPCMEGLVRLGKKSGEIVPGAAKSWKVSKDGTVWTFKFRKDGKWSDGTPLTANDFVFGIKRGLEPATGAQYSYQLYYIKNAKDYNLGKIKDFSEVGVKATDNYTLQITLNKPCTYFLQMLTTSIYFPLNENFYNKVDKKFALEANNMLYNGPWIMKSWIHGGSFKYTKNPNYWNKDLPKTNDLTFLVVQEFNTAVNMFKSGELDMTEISGDQLPQFKNSKEIVKTPAGIYYFQFNTLNKFFKNEKIRQAISMAIDRNAFCKYIRKDGSEAAYAFVPNGVAAGDTGETFREVYGEKVFKYDVPQAKKLLAEGLKEIGFKGKMKVNLLLDNTPAHRKDGQFIQEELNKNLGIDVVLEPNTFQSRLSRQNNKDFDFVYGGWLPDYNDPMTYMDLWYSTGGNNHSSWANNEYDKCIDLANSSTDNKVRMDAMAKAEKILLKEFPITPLYFRPSIWLIKSDLKDVLVRPVGLTPEFTYAFWK